MVTIRTRYILMWSTLAALLVALAALAQVPPSFDGKWILIPETGVPPSAPGRAAPATAGSGWGPQITITQEGGRLVIERLQFSSYDVQPPMRFIYVLDGSESRNVINMGRGPQEQISRATWKGPTLVITTRHAATSQATMPPAEVTHVFSLVETNTLLIEMIRPGEAPAASTKARYKRN